MPTVVPNSPGAAEPFGSDFEHVAAHRALEAAVEGIDSSGISVTGTISAVAATITNIGLGGQTPGTSSTAAPVKGLYRTAGTVGVGIPSMSTTSSITTIVSVETQVGNPVQPGVPVIASPQAALPATVTFTNAFCLNTNSITFQFTAITGINATTTVLFHVFSIDTIP